MVILNVYLLFSEDPLLGEGVPSFLDVRFLAEEKSSELLRLDRLSIISQVTKVLIFIIFNNEINTMINHL